jgi:hypothetical protein
MSNALHALLAPHGLIVLGSFAVTADDRAPAAPGGVPARVGTVIGNAGPGMWRAFKTAGRNEAHPLNMWSKRVLDPVAEALGAAIVYPFDEPFHPFPRWAARTGTIFPSPMTPSIHPIFGTWFGLRGALFSVDALCPPTPPAAPPCERCAEKPCRTLCPSEAIQRKDAALCHGYLESHPDSDCMAEACRARRSCPVGRDYAYGPEQARFHMQAFTRDFGAVMRRCRRDDAKDR